MRGQQRYLCKSCGLNFTDTPRPGQAAGHEGCCRAALCQRPVDELHRQAARGLDAYHPGLARAVRGSLRAKPEPEGRAVVRAMRIASRENAPEPTARCLTPMFPMISC